MDLIDTHCHIYYDKYIEDIDQVINRAKEHNISNIICVGVDFESSKKSLDLAEKYEMVYATAGYHPHDSKDAKDDYNRYYEDAKDDYEKEFQKAMDEYNF